MKLHLAACLGLCLPTIAAAEGRVIATVNAPLAHIAQTLAGPDTQVIFSAPAEGDPAFWSPSADDIQRYQEADLILLNGAGYAKWVSTASLPRARLVDTTGQVQDRLIEAEAGPSHKHGPEGEHEHAGEYAFTTWLDPEIAAAQVAAAAEAISRRWPELEASVAEGQAGLEADIAAMGTAFAGFAEGLADRQIIASHPVYQYLDRAYLGHIQSLHWEPDAFPGEADWAAFDEMLRSDKAPLMIWEGEPTGETRVALTDRGVEIVVLDPMGNAGDTSTLFRDIAAQVE